MTETEGIAYRDPVQKVGYAQLNHVMALDTELSDGAYRTYALYIKYAQQEDHCYPGIKRIARERKKSMATISRHNAELESLGYITRVRQTGTSSMTYIENISQTERFKAIARKELEDRKQHLKNDTTNISKMRGTSSQKRDVNNNQYNNNQSNKNISATAEEPSPKQVNAAPITEKSDNSTSPPDCEKKYNEYDKNGKPLNEHQKYFQKIAQAFDFNIDLMTQVDKGRMNKYAKKVREGGYTLDDIRKAKLHWKEIWPGNTGQSPDESRFTKCLEVVRKQRVERYGDG